MHYEKPHLSYDQQVKLLETRGLDVGHHGDAVRALKRIGYYRLSAYTYPMRAPLAGTPEPGSKTRADQFVTGATLRDAVLLHDFDQRLRRALLTAIQVLEVALRTKVAYYLGKTGPLSHLDVSCLNTSECAAHAHGPDHDGTKHDAWLCEFNRLASKAAGEDYMKHFKAIYGGEVPIWAAIEFMTMGNLIALYRLMDTKRAGHIARELGVKDARVLFGWLKALNVLRNHCAHNARIWNRSTVYPPSQINPRMVDADLHHLQDADAHKVYFLAGVLAYLVARADPTARYVEDFRTAMKKFPVVLGMTPQTSMGFTDNWQDEDLWSVS